MSRSENEVTLREITKDNLRDVLRLKVAPNQEHLVASNAISLAQAHFEEVTPWYRAVYAEDTPVGFLMLKYDAEEQIHFLWRFMIAEPFQKHGYGRKALELLFAHVKTLPKGDALHTSCVPGEGGPGAFYEKIGFVSTGEEDGGELGLRREL